MDKADFHGALVDTSTKHNKGLTGVLPAPP
jgi:hypothetical protein